MRTLSEESRAAFLASNRFETVLPDAARKVSFRLAATPVGLVTVLGSRRMRSAVLALPLALCLAAGGNAQADEPRLHSSSLSWVRLAGAESCLGGSELARAVEERLGRSVFVSAAEADLVVEGRAELVAVPPGYRAVVTITDRAGAMLGDRVVDSPGPSCEGLGALLAVAIAVMIDPLIPPPEPSPERPPRVIVRTKRVVVPAPRPRWHFETEGSLGAALGLLPDLSVGGLGALVVEPPGFIPILLEGAIFLGRSDEADLLQAHGGVALCPLARRGRRVGLAVCAGIDAGGLFASARGDGVPDRERLVAQARASVRGHLRVVGPLALGAGLHLVVPFRHDDLTAEGRTFFSPDPVAGILTLGLGLVFR